MSTDFELNTKPRDVFGTRASRRLRRLDQVPAMIYGADQNNEAVLLDHNEIMRNLGVEAFHSAIISLKPNLVHSRWFCARFSAIEFNLGWCMSTFNG